MNSPVGRSDYKSSFGMGFRDIKNMNSPWRAILTQARFNKYVKGDRLPLGKDLLFLDRGSICLTQSSPEGAEKIIWYIYEGCVFGETPFFDPTPNTCSFVCMSACRVYSFSHEYVKQVCAERPDLLLNLLHSMARKIRILSSQASSLYLDSVLVRICKFLLQRLVPGSNPLTANIGISQQEMASLIGVHRISLYRALRRQQARGLFGPIIDDKITILKPRDFYKLTGVSL